MPLFNFGFNRDPQPEQDDATIVQSLVRIRSFEN
jgi:hypothetical protein